MEKNKEELPFIIKWAFGLLGPEYRIDPELFIDSKEGEYKWKVSTTQKHTN
jgi:hypothetical protein